MRFIILAAALLLSVSASGRPASGPSARDAELLDRIELASPRAFTGRVRHTKPGKKDYPAQSGDIYFTAPGSFSMRFDNGEYLIFHKDRYKSINQMGTFDLSVKKGPFNKLMKTLLWSVGGQLRSAAELQKGSIEIQEEADRYRVSISTSGRLTSGYRNITICYRKTDLIPVELSVTDFIGRVDHYAISDYRPGVRGAESVFNAPDQS